ncbi:MAG: CPBP family intramembrane metalloprotease [Flavobacteriaceae bacterium]|nr:MAG: CPBP family intramembrane metalloprotease [Flavobacteriaceae bacterium]
MLHKLWGYIKNPVYKEYKNAPSWYKRKIFFYSLIWCLVIGVALVILSGAVTLLFDIEVGGHASEELFSKSIGVVFLLVAIVAPVIEELIFRGPLKLFEKSPHFKYAYYVSALAFGAIHIANYEDWQQIVWLTPLLVAPQIFIGFFLGYIRVKLGLLWSILLHAAYNTVLFLPVVLVKLLEIPLE